MNATSQKRNVELHVISDSTGETAARIALAVRAQFPDQGFVTVRHPRIESTSDLQLAVERMNAPEAVALATLVSPSLRSEFAELCRRERVALCDLLARPLAAVARVAGMPARMVPRARPALDESYFRRVSAIEFAVKNDDGLGRGLTEAEIVLVGVSRTSKTPLAIYLGTLGWKATNVPLVAGIDPPAALFELDRSRIVGLTIGAQRLAEIRTERLALMGGDSSYADLNAVYGELEFAAQVHRRLQCPVFDVSEHAIEELALLIIRSVERRRIARREG